MKSHSILFPLRLSLVYGLALQHSSLSASISQLLTHEDAQNVISQLYPTKQFDQRMNLGRDAQGLTDDDAVQGNDPRLAFTYAEFPLESFDILIDAGLQAVMGDREPSSAETMRLVDLGSGCARLVLYAALSRGWDVQGIEIGRELHDMALTVLEKGIGSGYFKKEIDDEQKIEGATLLLGDAKEYSNVLESADIVFAYSTVFPAAEQFNIDLGALVLRPEWSQMLASECQEGCVAITTDRALDPQFGWELIDRMDVENPEVFGSTGYIHILRRKRLLS